MEVASVRNTALVNPNVENVVLEGDTVNIIFVEHFAENVVVAPFVSMIKSDRNVENVGS